MNQTQPEAPVIPESFKGYFEFTNFSDEPFTAMWNSVAYTFPPMTTSPLIILKESPENVQEIRKRFAKKLAEREFAKTQKFKDLSKSSEGMPTFRSALSYQESDLSDLTQKCLMPLEVATPKVVVEDVAAKEDSVLLRDERGRRKNRVISENENLAGDAVPE